MRIIELKAENIKKIRAVSIRPDGALVQITGPNGQGKTSVLDSIFWALAGTKGIDSVPVRKGEEKAVIRLDLGEVIVTRRFTSNGGTSLEVAAANGAKFPSPQRMLDDLLGSLTFDPLAFTRQEPKAQLETLRRMVKLDVDIDALDAKNKELFESRAGLNRSAKAAQAQADGIAVPEGTPEVAPDIAAMIDQLDAAGTHNTILETRKHGRTRAAEEVENIKYQSEQIAEQINDLTKKRAQIYETYTALVAKLESAEPLPEPIDTKAMIVATNAAREIVGHVSRRMTKQKHTAEAAVHAASAAKLTEQMEANTKLKSETIAKADMPVPGLAFGAGEVLYNDLPLAQASSAEQLRISVAIAMAANPKLRVLRIKDGSLLDETSLETLAQTAELNDFQIWVERVDSSGTVGIVMEDGNARQAGNEARPEPATQG